MFSDDVLSTMGQAFVLAQQLASKGGSGAHRDGNYAAIDEALRMPPGAESFYSEALDAMKEKGGSNYFDISPNAPGDSDTYFDIAPNKPGAGGGANALYMDVAPDPTGEGGDAYLDVTHSLAQMSMASKQNGTSLYDTAGSEAATQAFVQNLNANDTYLQMTADTKVKLQQHEDKGNDTYVATACRTGFAQWRATRHRFACFAAPPTGPSGAWRSSQSPGKKGSNHRLGTVLTVLPTATGVMPC